MSDKNLSIIAPRVILNLRVTMADDVIVYQWECPVCGIKRMCLSHEPRSIVLDHAENAIRTHVRFTDGGGHGDQGTVPSGLESMEVVDYVHFTEAIGGRTTAGSG